MKIVWQPDTNSVYLSSSTDNLALHQIPLNEIQAYPNQDGQFLDHFGFMMDSPESVKALYDQMAEKGIPIVKLPKQHRDGSYSFYLADPDQNTIQVLYEPNVSRMW
jgi:catechol-2,3-dioxygenase